MERTVVKMENPVKRCSNLVALDGYSGGRGVRSIESQRLRQDRYHQLPALPAFLG